MSRALAQPAPRDAAGRSAPLDARARRATHRAVRLAALLAAVLVAPGCATTQVRRVGERVKGDPTWPRAGGRVVRYLGELKEPAHVGITPSFWATLWGWLSGSEEKAALYRPLAVACADDGRVAVADPGNHAVRLYDAATNRHLRLAEGLKAPAGLAFVDRRLVVADAEAQALFAFDADGKATALGVSVPPLSRPAGLAYDAVGRRLFVVDVTQHRVHVLPLTGAPASSFGERGEGPGQFNFPTHAAFAQGKLYVTDSLNARVQVFDGALRFERSLGGLGDTPGDSPRPKGVAVDAKGTVWLVDGAFDVVQAFDANGELVAVVGGAGVGPGKLWLPGGAAVDRQGRLWLADTWNQRVQVFATEEVPP